MTEELNKVVEELKDCVAKNVKLEADIKQSENRLYEVFTSNYENILKEDIKLLEKLVSDVCSKFDFSITVQTSQTDYECRFSCSSVLSKFIGQNNAECWLRANACTFTPQNIKRENLNKFTYLLGSEDNATKLLNEIYKAYAEGLKYLTEKIQGKNTGLETKLEGLSDSLTSTSAIKEEEDGSIEIHLNGKTYKGVLKEE